MKQQAVVNDLIKALSGRGTKACIECLNAFHVYLKTIRDKHVKNAYTTEHLIIWTFKDGYFNSERDALTFCKVNLYVAEHCLQVVIDKILILEKENIGAGCKKFKDVIENFLHDLKPIIEFLERQSDPKFCFLEGSKYYGTDTWLALRTCNQLLWTDCYEKNYIDLRTGLNLSIFLLRQTLELKFKRIIGIGDIYHKATADKPKLRHDFFYNFLVSNRAHFTFHTPHLKEIGKIYKWSNFTIHTGTIPWIWVSQYALEVVTPLLKPREVPQNQSWSIYNSVVVTDLKELQKKFMGYFQSHYPDSDWCVEFMEPEAEIK